ncbi:MAG TPA: pitrilysin family protein, partial [Myxococcota bacterium]|nr:pitrilysin family protein [Myxococcota bacterium]
MLLSLLLCAQAQEIPFERYELPNGLQVILHEDHSLPQVVVDIWYQVGSKDEAKGRSGFAHLFEHLMFMGTNRLPGSGFDSTMEAYGGWNNAWTMEDATNYYDVGPANLLPLFLWLEADRMQDLAVAMTQEKVDLQREVVRNERRQSYEDEPYGAAWLEVPRLLYPEGHPYAHTVIGSHEDLQAASLQDVKDFFTAWYVPNNASLVVAGDFNPAEVKPLIERSFGHLPMRP